MALDVGPTYQRARELRAQAENLRAVKRRIESYKNLLNLNWQGAEVTYYISAIDKTRTKITNTANSLDSLASSLERTANQIRAEELAEEERQRQERLAEQARLEEERQRQAAASVAQSTSTKKKR